jgi:hypothetical protein
MWPVMVAMVVAGQGAATRPSVRAATAMRAAPAVQAPLASPVAESIPEVVRRVEAQEAPSAIARMMNGVELNGPVVLKPTFRGGYGAAIALKF